MERVREHFCWIKVVHDTTSAESAAPDAEWGLPRSDGTTTMTMPIDWTLVPGRNHGVMNPWGPADHGGVDPRPSGGHTGGHGGPHGGHGGPHGGHGGGHRLEASGDIGDAGASDASQANIDRLGHGNVDARRPRGTLAFAGTSFLGAWHADAIAGGSSGDRNLRIVHRPVPGRRDEALRWLDSPEGGAWLEGALAHSLIAFVAIGEL
jgi:hypothetical protein